HYLILKDIYSNPSFSTAVSVGVIAFVLLCDSFSILLGSLSSGWFPLEDSTNMLTLAKINRQDPDKGSKLYEAIATQHAQQPWIIRRLFRIRMPKKLPEV